MAETLTSIGKILGLIGGILGIINGAMSIIGDAISTVETLGSYGTTIDGTVGSIVTIIVGILAVFVSIDRVEIKDQLVLGIVLIILGFFGATLLAVLGGILVIIDKFT